MRLLTFSSACAGVALVLAAPAVAAQPTVDGSWMNPRHSVAVRTGQCGARLCAWVVWANADAKADARAVGVAQLIGTALLQNYVPKGDGSWSGSVYVPDMGRRFPSTISPVGAKGLKVRGCLVGGYFCRSQLWERVEHVPVG